MRRARWLAEWRNSKNIPVMYHCISRIVDRRFVLGAEEKEKFRAFMRMQEKFTGCRVLAYCLMDNHFHLLLEVPHRPEEGVTLTDKELFARLNVLYSEAYVAEVAGLLASAREQGNEELVRQIHERYTYRMHSLSEFMKGLLQRYTQWHNRKHHRRGTLWEDRFKSVIVEDGVAARTMAAYIDLNPVRAGMVKEPADYRWSSYGEAIGGGTKGNGKRARAGLVRAYLAHEGVGADAEQWAHKVSRKYRTLLMNGAKERSEEVVTREGTLKKRVLRKGISRGEVESMVEKDIPFARMLRCRVRYFTDGAVIGSREFVNEAFASARERFTEGRKDGARAMKGAGVPARGVLWSMRDLRVNVGDGL